MKKLSGKVLSSLTAAAMLAVVGSSFNLAFNTTDALSADANYGVEIKPQWTPEGELLQPADFRALWVYLGSPFTPNALNDGKADFLEFHNVYVQPSAIKAYRDSGKWPEAKRELRPASANT